MRADLLTATWSTDENRTGGARWRNGIRELFNYLRRDMRDAEVQRKLLYPKSSAKHVLRTVPIVHRIAREIGSGLYLRPPARRFDGLSPATLERVERIYRGARVDRMLRTAHEQLVAMNQSTVWIWPVPQIGGVRLLCPPPHDQEVQTVDMMSTDEHDVEMWWLRIPIQTDAVSGIVSYAIARISPTEAVWETHPSKSGTGIWMRDGSNPIGQVPVIMLRASDPAPGEWWAPIPEDLLAAQRAVDHDYTDLGAIARLQGYSQLVITGMAPTDELETGPEAAIMTANPDANIDFKSPTPDLAGYRESNVEYLRQVIASNGLNPSVLNKSAGVTALAKMLELQDRDVERERTAIDFRRAEQRLYNLTRLWVNHLRGVELLPEARVTVEYREHVQPVDKQAAVMALESEIKLGLTSAIRERMKRDGIGYEEARRRVNEDLADTAELARSAPVETQAQLSLVESV